MLSILFVGLGAHLRGGIRVWEVATARSESAQRQRVAFDRLERDFANAFVYNSEEAAFGPSPKLREPQVASDQMRWFTLEPSSTARSVHVRQVSYSCFENDNTHGLWRTSQSISEIRARREAVPELLLPGCTNLSFRYAYLPTDQTSTSLDWEPQWLFTPEKGEWPRLVEVTVTISDEAATAEAASGSQQQMRRRYTLPVGLLAQKPDQPPS